MEKLNGNARPVTLAVRIVKNVDMAINCLYLNVR